MVQVSNIRSAEQLISFPSNSDPSNTVDHSCSDLYIYAKTLFDTKEYKRCSHILVNESDSLSKFLCIYAEYLHVESSTQYQTSIKRDGNTKAGRKKVHSDLLQLCTRLENIVDKDAFLLYLTGVLFNRLENSIKASQYLVEAINRNSLIWSAWQELGTTIGSPEDVPC